MLQCWNVCNLLDILPHQHTAVFHLPFSYNPVLDWVWCLTDPKMDSVYCPCLKKLILIYILTVGLCDQPANKGITVLIPSCPSHPQTQI